MPEHPIQGLMKTAMENLKEMTDVNTIIGDPIETADGKVILTVSKVGFGFVAGGSEFKTQSENGESGELYEESDSESESENAPESELPFGGGSGGGVSITPIAFLVVGPHDIKTIHLDNSTHLYEKLLDLAPHAVDKVQEIIEKMNRKEDEWPARRPSKAAVRQRRAEEESSDDYYN